MTTLTSGATTITPTAVEGYLATSESSTIVHNLLDSTIALSVGPDAPRNGSLKLYFASYSAAWGARAALVKPGVWALVDTNVPAVGMTFVRQGSMTIELDDDTRKEWFVTVGYQELSS